MKKLLIIIPLLFILIGCTNKEEENKIAYLEYKNELEKLKLEIDKLYDEPLTLMYILILKE